MPGLYYYSSQEDATNATLLDPLGGISGQYQNVLEPLDVVLRNDQLTTPFDKNFYVPSNSWTVFLTDDPAYTQGDTITIGTTVTIGFTYILTMQWTEGPRITYYASDLLTDPFYQPLDVSQVIVLGWEATGFPTPIGKRFVEWGVDGVPNTLLPGDVLSGSYYHLEDPISLYGIFEDLIIYTSNQLGQPTPIPEFRTQKADIVSPNTVVNNVQLTTPFPRIDGYYFSHWIVTDTSNTDQGNGPIVGDLVYVGDKLPGDRTLTYTYTLNAQFTAGNEILYYDNLVDAQTGANAQTQPLSKNPTHILYNSDLTIPFTPITGKLFGGWKIYSSTDPDAQPIGTRYFPETVLPNSVDTLTYPYSFFAVWNTPITYKATGQEDIVQDPLQNQNIIYANTQLTTKFTVPDGKIFGNYTLVSDGGDPNPPSNPILGGTYVPPISQIYVLYYEYVVSVNWLNPITYYASYGNADEKIDPHSTTIGYTNTLVSPTAVGMSNEPGKLFSYWKLFSTTNPAFTTVVNAPGNTVESNIDYLNYEYVFYAVWSDPDIKYYASLDDAKQDIRSQYQTTGADKNIVLLNNELTIPFNPPLGYKEFSTWGIYFHGEDPVPQASPIAPGVIVPGTTTELTYSYGLYAEWLPLNICMLENTKILCKIQDEEKWVNIQTLTQGTLVKTSQGEFKAIDMIGSSIFDNPGSDARVKNSLYVCKYEKYNEIFQDLYLTGAHSILVDSLSSQELDDTINELKQVYMTEGKFRLLTFLDQRAEPFQTAGLYHIWHFSLENDNDFTNYGIYANGLLVETASKRIMRNNFQDY